MLTVLSLVPKRGMLNIDFGATPTNYGEVLVTGLTDQTSHNRKEAHFQADDSTTDHPQVDHEFMCLSAKTACAYVDSTTMLIKCYLLMGQTTGKFTVHWVTVGHISDNVAPA